MDIRFGDFMIFHDLLQKIMAHGNGFKQQEAKESENMAIEQLDGNFSKLLAKRYQQNLSKIRIPRVDCGLSPRVILLERELTGPTVACEQSATKKAPGDPNR